MRVARDLASVAARVSCVTFGVFDGVHLGHQALLGRTVQVAREGGLRSVALTFEPVPEAVLHPGRAVPVLTPCDEKRSLIEELGVQLLVIHPFDALFAGLSPGTFVREVLVGCLGVRIVVAGPRTRFGRRGQGDVGMLERQGRALGFRVERVPEVNAAGMPVSSSAVRELLAGGRLSSANKMLGRPYALSGRVVKGEGRGRTLGFPTLNLSLPRDKALPAHGIYAGCALIRGERLPAAINIGERPTFRAAGVAVEAHILASAVPTRVRKVTLELLHRLRRERAFSSPELLARQISLDCERARCLLGA